MLLLGAVTALVPPVCAAKTPPAVARSTAADAAGLGREAVALLAARAQDADPEVRAMVAESWGGLGNRAAIPLLKRALSDNNPDSRIAAAASLRRLGDVQGLLALIDETKPLVSGKASSPADELRRMARDAARARAVFKLGEISAGAAREALMEALKDPSGVVRDAAAVVLARLGEGDAGPFVAALKDSDEGVRASAAKSLGLIGREGAEVLEKAASSDASAAVRAESALALGGFSDAASIDILARALKDKSGRVRLAAAKALSRRLEPEATAALKKLLETAPRPELALTASAALAARGEDVDLSLPELTMGQKDVELKGLAVEVLGASRRPQAQELLLKAMREDPESRVRVLAAGALVSRLRRIEGGH